LRTRIVIELLVLGICFMKHDTTGSTFHATRYFPFILFSLRFSNRQSYCDGRQGHGRKRAGFETRLPRDSRKDQPPARS
jgi:hypothetical protein